jgi:hypothetical protein
MIRSTLPLTITAAMLLTSTAFAQQQVQIGAGQPSESLPPPQSDTDPIPPPPSPVVGTQGVTKQAGIGSTQAYGRAGVLELGGSAGFRGASNFTQLNFDPSIGWFVADNIELTGILGVTYAKLRDDDRTLVRALIEPSFHLPFTQTLFGFIGIGAGVAYTPEETDMTSGEKFGGAGFALSPRIGANILVGRSGVLTPSFNVDYATTEVATIGQQALIGVSVTYGLNIGYTVMW